MSLVKLISYTNQPEFIVAIAAKMCYYSGDINEIIDSIKNNENSVKNSLNTILQSKHESVIEHASFTFYIGNISRACMSQITRHRMASFSVKSQRYVTEQFTREANFIKNAICPESIVKNPDAKYLYDDLIMNMNAAYKSLLKCVPREDARSILPNACSTQLIMTANARSLYNFFKLRCCYKAQDEIRDVANKMLKECRLVAPILFKNAGPNCKFCTEKNPCNKYLEFKEHKNKGKC